MKKVNESLKMQIIFKYKHIFNVFFYKIWLNIKTLLSS